jgi:hypothetical protein
MFRVSNPYIGSDPHQTRQTPGYSYGTPTLNYQLAGWWYTYPSEKYEFVSWDDDIPNVWKVIIHSCSSHHQPDKTYRGFLKYGYPKTVGFPMGNNQSHGWFCNFWTQIQPSPMALDRRPPSGHLYRCELRKLPVQSHVGLSMVIQPVFENGEYERKGAYCRLYYHLVT